MTAGQGEQVNIQRHCAVEKTGSSRYNDKYLKALHGDS